MSPENRELFDELIFSTANRSSSTLVLLTTPNNFTSGLLKYNIEKSLPLYKHVDLDLTRHSVISLRATLNEQLSSEVLQSTPVSYIVHLWSLETSTFEEINSSDSVEDLLNSLNFERELLFRFPFLLFIWTTSVFAKKLRKNAPDLASWLFYQYEFADETPSYGIPNLPFLSEPIKQHIGNTPERLANIKALTERLAHSTGVSVRDLRDAFTLRATLMHEYTHTHHYEMAEHHRSLARELLERLNLDGTQKGEFLFTEAYFYFTFRDWDSALRNYQEVLLFDNVRDNVIYYQIGRVYEEQRKWTEARDAYQKALKVSEERNDVSVSGRIYHQLGRVSEGQGQLGEALEYYHKGIELNTKNSQKELLSATFHHIGNVYELQKNWDVALKYYQKAVELNIELNQKYNLGSNFHQIGFIYAEQQKWSEALEYYQKAIEWNNKTGQNHLLGGTYHQRGIILYKQGKILDALDNYQKAVIWNTQTNQRYRLGDTYYQIGMAYAEQQSWEEAKKAFQQSIKSNNETNQKHLLGSSFYGLGVLFYRIGQWSDALNYFRLAQDNEIHYQANPGLLLHINENINLTLEHLSHSTTLS